MEPLQVGRMPERYTGCAGLRAQRGQADDSWAAPCLRAGEAGWGHSPWPHCYSVPSVLQADPSRILAPRHVWSQHTLPITDLHCGFGGPMARVATASLDQTAKVASPTWTHGFLAATGSQLERGRLASPLSWLSGLQTSHNPYARPRTRRDGLSSLSTGNSHSATLQWPAALECLGLFVIGTVRPPLF